MMRSNARFYLYIGAGAIAIVILVAWLVTMVTNNRGSENNNTHVQQQENKDQTANQGTAESKGEGDQNDVMEPPISDKPLLDVSGGDLDYMPETDHGKYEENADNSETEDTVKVTATTYTFHAGSILQWPVHGNIIMNYSMEKMIYFETLDAYKYHPAICIEAEEGTPVVAGATGKVVSVTNEPDTGLTVGMRIGTEYIIYYGNLKECSLKVGDHVNRGQEFAKIEEPTKYFLIEGSHLYLRLERNEEPVNPLSYLDFSE